MCKEKLYEFYFLPYLTARREIFHFIIKLLCKSICVLDILLFFDSFTRTGQYDNKK